MSSARIFGAPGKGIPGWDSTMAVILRKAGITPHFSFKDWNDDTSAVKAINAWMDLIPADVLLAILTYRHEPEGDMDSNEFRRRWGILCKTVRAHKNGRRIRLYCVLTLYPSRFKIGDRFNKDWHQWVGAWQQWAPTDARGVFLPDAIGFDCYQTVNSVDYENPEDFFRIPVSAAHALNAPLAITEWGALCTPGDKTGTGRAKWIVNCFNYLNEGLASRRVVQLNWWHATGSAGHNYRLSDKPSADAYNKIISASNK